MEEKDVDGPEGALLIGRKKGEHELYCRGKVIKMDKLQQKGS